MVEFRTRELLSDLEAFESSRCGNKKPEIGMRGQRGQLHGWQRGQSCCFVGSRNSSRPARRAGQAAPACVFGLPARSCFRRGQESFSMELLRKKLEPSASQQQEYPLPKQPQAGKHIPPSGSRLAVLGSTLPDERKAKQAAPQQREGKQEDRDSRAQLLEEGNTQQESTSITNRHPPCPKAAHKPGITAQLQGNPQHSLRGTQGTPHTGSAATRKRCSWLSSVRRC